VVYMMLPQKDMQEFFSQEVDEKINESTFSLTSKERRIFDVSSEIIDNDCLDIGFVCRSMVSASMPHSKIRGNQYKRKSQNFTLEIVGSEAAGGVPYGVYPRLILSWITTEVVKSGNREITFGNSLSDFMKTLGLQVTGGKWGTITRFKEQLKRLFSSHISFTYEDKSSGQWIRVNMNIADKAHILWDPESPNDIDVFKSQVTLGEVFFEEIRKTPIPVDIRAINALKDSSLALDIYFWLTYRLSYLNVPIELSFEKLQMQFGSGYEDTKQGRYDFKRKFLIQLKHVLTIYPKANVKILEKGLKISPSPTHVPKKSFNKVKKGALLSSL
jgi:hypothetical protein